MITLSLYHTNMLIQCPLYVELRQVIVIGFGQSLLGPYEASGKCYYLHTHCSLHWFIFYAVTATYKSLFTCKYLLKIRILMFLTDSKHLHPYMIIKLLFFFTCVKILTRSTFRHPRVKFSHALYFRNQQTME